MIPPTTVPTVYSDLWRQEVESVFLEPEVLKDILSQRTSRLCLLEKPVSSYGVCVSALAQIFNPFGWNTDTPLVHTLNPKQ